MNRSLVLRLILKDWYLSRAHARDPRRGRRLSVGVLQLRGGMIGFSAILDRAHHHRLSRASCCRCRPSSTSASDRTCAFVMSLPISPMEYTTAKILGNLSAFRRALAGDRDRRGRPDRHGAGGGLHPVGGHRSAGTVRLLLSAPRRRDRHRIRSVGDDDDGRVQRVVLLLVRPAPHSRPAGPGSAGSSRRLEPTHCLDSCGGDRGDSSSPSA